MRFKKSKVDIMQEIQTQLDWRIKERLTRLGTTSWGYSQRDLTPQEQALVDIIKIVTDEKIQILLDNIYTQEEFEEDLQLK